MDGSLQEKRGHFRLHYGTLIRAIGAAIWLTHFLMVLLLSLDPHFELKNAELSESERTIHKTLIEYRSKRIYFVAAEHLLMMWNLIYAVAIGSSKRNRIWAYIWMHFNWTAVPLLSLVIVTVQFVSQDMSYFIVLDNGTLNESLTAVIYFMLGFNTYLLAYNQLRMLQQQLTRPFKPGWVVLNHSANREAGSDQAMPTAASAAAAASAAIGALTNSSAVANEGARMRRSSAAD